jgi:hypothetical protein
MVGHKGSPFSLIPMSMTRNRTASWLLDARLLIDHLLNYREIRTSLLIIPKIQRGARLRGQQSEADRSTVSSS